MLEQFNHYYLFLFPGYEEIYTISQLSPKSVSHDQLPEGVVLQTSQTENLAFNIEPSLIHNDHIEDIDDIAPEDIINEEERDKHIIVARSADPNRESRSINIDDVPVSNNNEIDSEIELHNKRKYYEIHPTKTVDFYKSDDDEILMSEGYGDKLEFRFPGEGKRVPKARALSAMGPQINPTAVQPIFATVSLKDQGRQNTEIQNIITGIVKLLNGNVNVQANSQLLNGRPGRPMASRINNRGPPRISDVPAIIPDFDKPITPPTHVFHPTKTPPPYPFDRPHHHGVNLPEQIVPPLPPRPGFHRPLPPWQRPRPRPPNRRPNPGLPVYKPMPPLPQDLPDLDDSKPDEELPFNENETSHSENNIHHDDKETLPIISLPELNITSIINTTKTDQENNKNSDKDKEMENDSDDDSEKETIDEIPITTTDITSTTTTETTTTSSTTEKPTTTEKSTTEKPTTEKPSTTTEKKTEKPTKPDKKKEVEKNKDKYRPLDEKFLNKTTDKIKNDTSTDPLIESSIFEIHSLFAPSISDPTPTDGLISHAPTISVLSASEIIKTSSINTQPSPSK